jgi:clan AA aspartic protease
VTQAQDDHRRVGLTFIDGVVTGPTGTSVDVRFLIDTGAQYSLLPHEIWRQLGLAPRRTLAFNLADGTRIDRGISDCRITVEGIEGPTPVILGEPGDVALLGIVTLENLGLVFNPFDRSLRPMTEAPLMGVT